MERKIVKLGIIEFRDHSLEEPSISFREVFGDLDNLQAIVGGNIEMPYASEAFTQERVDFIVNENGKIEDLPISTLIVDGSGEVIDVICGSLIFSSHTDEGEICSLTQNQIEFILRRISVCIDVNSKQTIFIVDIG